MVQTQPGRPGWARPQQRGFACRPMHAAARRTAAAAQQPARSSAAEEPLRRLLGLPQQQCDALLERAGLAGEAAAAEAAHASLCTLLLSQRRALVLRIVAASPALLAQPLAAWWDFLSGYGVPHARFLALADQHPDLLTAGGLYRAGLVLLTLKGAGLSDATIRGAVLTRCPQALAVDVRAQLGPLLAALAAHGLVGAPLRDLLARCPRLLLADFDADLAPTLEALRRAGVGGGAGEGGSSATSGGGLQALLARAPSLLAQDLGSELQPKLGFLSQEVGLAPPQVAALLAGDPGCLTNALPNLRRKAAFLRDVLALVPADIADSAPSFFSASLLHATGPRFRFAQAQPGGLAALSLPAAGEAGEAGGAAAAAADGGPGARPLRLHLGLLLEGPDAAFAARLGVPLAAYQEFAEGWRAGEGLAWAGTNTPFALPPTAPAPMSEQSKASAGGGSYYQAGRGGLR